MKLTLKYVTDRLIPRLREDAKTEDDFVKRLTAELDGYTVEDEDGEPVELKTIIAEVKPDQNEADLSAAIKELRDATKAHTEVVRKTLKAGDVKVVKENLADDPKGGYKSVGEFAADVVRAAHPNAKAMPNRMDSWIKAWQSKQPTNYANEGTLADGGALVPPGFASEILSHMEDEAAILPMTANTPVTGNSMSFPADHTVSWDGQGIVSEKVGEAGLKPKSKPKFETIDLKLKKRAVIVPATDELLDDSTALESWINTKATEEIRFQTDDWFIRGTGTDEPIGILNSPALITTAQVVEDTTAVKADDLAAMYARMYAPYLRGSVWMINQHLLPDLTMLQIGQFPAYMPANGLSDSPFGTILGIPVIPTQHASAKNTVGDIMLVNWSKYRTITKATGVEAATSIHLWFDYDVTAFRFVFRVDGQPSFNAPIPHRSGEASETMSAFVALAVRADNS